MTPDLLPPHSIEAEQSVIGAVLIDANAMERLDGLLTDADFYRRDHRTIFAAAKALHDRAEEVDVITLAEWLRSRGELESVGGIDYLSTILNNTPSAANVTAYARAVRERAGLRNVMAAAAKLQAAAAENDAEAIPTVLAEAENALADLSGGRSAKGPVRFQDAVLDVLNDVDARRERSGKLAGLPTGFIQFDAMTGGLEPGQLVIVAAGPALVKVFLPLAWRIESHSVAPLCCSAVWKCPPARSPNGSLRLAPGSLSLQCGAGQTARRIGSVWGMCLPTAPGISSSLTIRPP